MRILLTAATEEELLPTKDLIVCCTGIGSANTAYGLTKALMTHKPDLVINIGLCGSYKNELPIGTVVAVEEEIFADLGATEADSTFLDLKKLGFPLIRSTPPLYNEIKNPHRAPDFFEYDLSKTPSVRSITVNTVSGDEAQIAEMKKRYDPDIENMEGAAVALVCNRENIPCFEFRSVSNRVEPRDRSKWDIATALRNLHSFIVPLLSSAKKL